jgi:membrane-associated phospholipid phosphatase
VAAALVGQPGQQAEVTSGRSGGRGGQFALAAPGWVIAGVVFLAMAGVLTGIVAATPGQVRSLDEQFLRWMLAIRTPAAISVGKVLNVVGGGTVMWIVRIAIAGALLLLRRWRAVLVFVAAEACAELCIGPVKALVNRPRPPHSLVHVTGQSLPSGHALTAAVTAVVLALILTQPGRSRLFALVAAAAWSALVGLSRTYLSAHWLTDVLAGLLIGAGWATLWFGLLGTGSRARRTNAEVPERSDAALPG